MVRLPSSFIAAVLVLVSVGSASEAAETTPPPAGDFLAQQGGDLWRASKLVGVTVYGPGIRKVGDVNDVLMTREGKASYVVIGVGGFLGIGEKDVAIPFDRVTFSQEPMATAAGASADAQPIPTGLGTPAQTNGPGTGATVLPSTAANTAATTVPATAPPAPRSTAYPDHGMVSYTADQLKAAPTFSFAK